MKTPNLEHLEDHLETETPRRPAPHRRKRNMWFWNALVILLVGMIASGAFLWLYLQYAPLPPNDIANTSKLLASDGSVLTDLFDGGEKRVKISLKDVPQSLIDATIVTEDRTFYEHKGFSLSGIARALWSDLKSGSIVEGGSTITQQLAKNLFLTHEQTLQRKLREALLTLQLELNYSKDEILEQYLNVIYYGYGAYGIEMASQTYFAKSAKDLTLAESAMLAGIPKGPTYYSPFADLDKAKERQRLILDMMEEAGKITPDQARAAYLEELHFAKPKTPTGKAPYFTDFTSWQLKNTYGVTEEDLYRGGLRITTTLDPAMQQAAEQAIAEQMKDFPEPLQVSLIAMDPHTGAIKAMVGGRNYATSSYNRTLAKRQPGSAFKPFVYLTALNNRYTPATRIKSEPREFRYDDDTGNPKTYKVHNFADHYANDYITMRQAITTSDNVYAVTTNMDVGPEKVMTTAQRLGIESTMKPYPSLALGTFPASPLEMVRAYAALANGGYRVEPYTVLKIENSYSGDTKVFHPEKKSILDPGVTFLLTDMMKSVFEDPQGTGYRVHQLFQRPVAGKTGTTDTDAWMIGYTPDLVAAVWVGYDKDQLLSPVESHLAAPIFAAFMNKAHEKIPVRDFSVPPGVVEGIIDPTTGQLATENCPVRQREYFLEGAEPVEYCEEHPSLTGALNNAGQKAESSLRSFWDWITGKGKGP
jgi:1A family penicillin-binding protein